MAETGVCGFGCNFLRCDERNHFTKSGLAGYPVFGGKRFIHLLVRDPQFEIDAIRIVGAQRIVGVVQRFVAGNVVRDYIVWV